MTLHPSEALDLDFQLAWVGSEATLDPLGLSAPAFTARVPRLSEDFSQTHTYSDLDFTQIDGSVSARYSVTERLWLRGAYRYVDLSDDAPYLYDTSGRNHLVSMLLGWVF